MSGYDPELFVRQVLVAGIGERGQRAIAAATAPVAGPSLAHAIATLYAERAGFAVIGSGPDPLPDAGTPELALSAAIEVLAGSRAAVRALVAAVGAER
ncbi:MAG: hypothetical protein U0271_36425 [Polyangiaceae bacterium]